LELVNLNERKKFDSRKIIICKEKWMPGNVYDGIGKEIREE
jgi:hypothetical protein